MTTFGGRVGHQLELHAGAFELALEAGAGETRLELADVVQLVAGVAQPPRDRAQQFGAHGVVAQRRDGVAGGGAGRGDLAVGGVGVGLEHSAGPRVVRLKGGVGHRLVHIRTAAQGGVRCKPVVVETGLTIGPLRVEQVYEQIARRILQDIQAGLLVPGQRLPSERELARQMEVGRSSVREAIGVLQVDGIVETRPGSGSFVAADATARLSDELPAVLDAHDASPFALLQAREAFEPAVARMAADRARTDAFAERLLAEMEQLSDPASPDQRAIWSEADRMFHRQIGVMTGNPVVIAICDQLAEIMDQPLWRRLRDDSLSDASRMRIHIAEHRMIYEAVIEGDAEAAELYSRQHIRRVRRYMTRR